MDMRDRVQQEMGGFEKLVNKIPGYHGYKEKELAREADRLLRERLTRELTAQVDRLTALQNRLLSSGGIRLIGDVDTASRRLQTLADSIRVASSGYAGLFDAIKVKEEELNNLYNFDAALLDAVPSISTAIDAMETIVTGDPAEFKKAGQNLLTQVDTMNRQWNKRREALTAYAG